MGLPHERQKKVGLWFDPRTKLFFLLLTVLGVTMAPSLLYELGLLMLVTLVALLCGAWRKTAFGFLAYLLFYLFTLTCYTDGWFRTSSHADGVSGALP